jgi:hypothetical protein
MLLGCLLVWAALFGVGYLLYDRIALGCVMSGIAAVAAYGVWKQMGRLRLG